PGSMSSTRINSALPPPIAVTPAIAASHARRRWSTWTEYHVHAHAGLHCDITTLAPRMRWTRTRRSCKTVGGGQMPHDPCVIDRRTVPRASDGAGVDRERLVHRPDLRPAEVPERSRRRHRGHRPALWIAESRPLIRTEL